VTGQGHAEHGRQDHVVIERCDLSSEILPPPIESVRCDGGVVSEPTLAAVHELLVDNLWLLGLFRNLICIIVLIRSDVVYDAGELPLTQRTLCLDLRPL